MVKKSQLKKPLKPRALFNMKCRTLSPQFTAGALQNCFTEHPHCTRVIKK
jgi:hypothetical protein